MNFEQQKNFAIYKQQKYIALIQAVSYVFQGDLRVAL